MKYLEVDLKRKRQMVLMAKSKYQRMMEVRHQSFIEKKELSKVPPVLSRSAITKIRITS
jgi:hypothetical protein